MRFLSPEIRNNNCDDKKYLTGKRHFGKGENSFIYLFFYHVSFYQEENVPQKEGVGREAFHLGRNASPLLEYGSDEGQLSLFPRN